MLPIRFTNDPTLGRSLRTSLLEPLRAVESLMEDFDGVGGRMAIDVREEKDRYLIDADLPGFNKQDLDLTFEDGLLTITAEKKQETENKGETYHVRERRIGRFTRSLRLPPNVDPQSIKANLRDGLLTVTIDKHESAKPHKIEVKVG